ncbi:MAG TPA: LysR substrate-binding domain-containing protein, partial [Polyangiaceae bacterium]
ASLGQLHPEIDLEIIAKLRIMSLARHEADLAIRLGRPRDSELVGRRLGQMEFEFYGLAGVSTAKRRPALIAYDENSEFIPEARWLTSNFPDARLTLRSNSQLVQLEAARAGLGLALLPHYLVVGDARLRPVNLGKRPPPRDVWLLSRREAWRTPRVRAVAEYIISQFENW